MDLKKKFVLFPITSLMILFEKNKHINIIFQWIMFCVCLHNETLNLFKFLLIVAHILLILFQIFFKSHVKFFFSFEVKNTHEQFIH